MSKKCKSKARQLQLPCNDGKLIFESEEFTNVWYEIKGRAVALNVIIAGRHIILPGKFGDMRNLAHELLSVIEVWSSL